ncbi:PREDICTED: uncharacterized protein LOC109587809 [Amphimedon queenslandica]|uniref:C-terminal of Roc (COR) domain-containing protein n=1 Tax=Amphimedon queenslandica TaxID=400682 RepID=A0AAN0JRZ1_AMPQE|nr:PREDICTED: uncharacterized protein LOC109587809 [Amphimedon queenslandica]|eukprot:XP_019859588.1 PREDICTED: uncharacterized protein LOC109587809 [Amphimedon queenslandica]
MHGAPGAGKTCSQHLLLNEPPPAQATPSNWTWGQGLWKWERVDERELLNQLASAQVDQPTSEKLPESLKKSPTKNGSAKNGPAENRSAENGSAENGSAENGSAENGPAKNESAENGPAENESAENGSAKNGSAKNGSAENGSAENGSAENGSAENGSAENGSAENGSAENGSAENGSAENGSAENGSVENKSAENRSARNESAKNGLAENGPAENGSAKSESAESEPAKNGSAETNYKEVFEKILLAVKKSKKLCKNWVYFIDSGGQPAYRELLPLFTRAAALNIITIDLTKGLDEKKCEFHYRISQNTFPIKTKLQYSNLDIIRSTISSEAMLKPAKIPYVSYMPPHPHYLILGTRKELVTKKKQKEMNESLKEYIADKKVISHDKDNSSIIFPVNTLLPAGSKEREEASLELCTAISNFRVAMTLNVPIRLFIFEIALQTEAKKKERSFLTEKEVTGIGKHLWPNNKSDIDKALQYLHNVTIILYFHEVLPNIIFVDPKPILDVLSRLIAITYINQSNLHLITDQPPSADERDNLIDFGLFNESLLKVIGKQIFDVDFKSSHMIKLLKHLHIIVEVRNRKEGDYFFPCALPSYKKLNDPPTEIQPLFIGWEINNRGTTTLAIPQGLFPLTIVHLLKKRTDEVDFRSLF